LKQEKNQMFDTLKTDKTIESDGDNLGGSNFAPQESGIYAGCNIKLAYGTESAGKAKALNLLLETADGKEIKQQLWMTSGEAKGCLNYYMGKNPTTGKKDLKKYLPGFEMANHLCMMTLNKEISAVTPENKTIMLYDYSQGKEVATEVQMVTELLGKKITIGVIKQVVDKNVKDPATGDYVPSGETREENEIDKFFHHPSGLTVSEATAKMTEPVFMDKWAEKWTGVTKDKTKKIKGGPIGGTPNTTPAAAGSSTLFG
jgi:hypothetical protein